jgi:steroid 5-alpha reductase family enzyme
LVRNDIVFRLYRFAGINQICMTSSYRCAYNAFRNKHAVPYTAVSIASIVLFSLGCLINTMADVQMHTTKGIRKGLVTEGIFRLAQNPNYLGDYMRYGSFCLLSGHASSFLVLASVMSINYLSTQDPALKGGMLDRYGKAYAEWVEQVPNKITLNLDSNTCMIIGGILVIWATSFALGKFLGDKKFQVKKSKMA